MSSVIGLHSEGVDSLVVVMCHLSFGLHSEGVDSLVVVMCHLLFGLHSEGLDSLVVVLCLPPVQEILTAPCCPGSDDTSD